MATELKRFQPAPETLSGLTATNAEAQNPSMNNSGDIQLAIIIPAYKAEFLRVALDSIASQTEQRFQLYVGDDCSPAPIAEIVREFSKMLPIKYHRFDDNLGGISLVQHLERCIRMTCEPWIWIFSDDDFMDVGCVAAFFEELKRPGGTYDVYRFNSVWIDSKNNLTTVNPPHPQNETGSEFLLARLRGDNTSNMQELIFSRQAWETIGGIPDFPLGWASDDAFIAKLGARRPIRTISGPVVNWRLSGLNISSDKSNSASRGKLKASHLFVEWATDFFESHTFAEDKLHRKELNRLTENWFFNYVSYSWRFLSLRACWEIDRLAVRLWRRRKGHGFLKAIQSNCALAIAKIFYKCAGVRFNHTRNPQPDLLQP